MLSRVWLFAAPQTVAHQAPPSMGFSSKNTGAGCHFLLQGIFRTQGWKLRLLQLLHWQAVFFFFTTAPPGNPWSEKCPPQIHVHLKAIPVALFGNGRSADEAVRGWGETCIQDSCLYKRKERKFRRGERQGRGPVTVEAGLERCKCKPRARAGFRLPAELGRTGRGPPRGWGALPPERSGPAAALISDSSRRRCERTHRGCVQSPRG